MAEHFILSSAWNYSHELDELTIPPKHRRLLMENEFVRVIDACISLSEITPAHTHQWPSTLYVLSFSLRYDSQGTVAMDRTGDLFRVQKPHYGQDRWYHRPYDMMVKEICGLSV